MGDDDDDWIFTSPLCHTILQYLLYPDGHVGDILGYSLDSLHQASWLKPAQTTTHKTQHKEEAKSGNHIQH